jgi:multidrug transporter EmrE-like cation transporter
MSTQDIVILSAIETFADSTLRVYAQSNNPIYFGYGVIAYIGVIFYLIKCLQTQNVMYVNGMWGGVSTIIGSVAGYFVLGDRLDRPIQYVGLLLLIAGIFLLKTD